MAGLIDTPQAPDEELPEGATPPEEELDPEEEEAPSEGEITPEAAEAKMQIPPELKDAYTRVVAAGMKVMFDKATHAMSMDQMKSGEGSIGQRLGDSVARLLFVLLSKSKGAIPPQVLIPAGSTLLVSAADFLRKSGAEQVTNQDIAEGMKVMIETILKAFKLDPAKVQGYKGAPGLVDGPKPVDAPQAGSPPTDAPQPQMTGA